MTSQHKTAGSFMLAAIRTRLERAKFGVEVSRDCPKSHDAIRKLAKYNELAELEMHFAAIVEDELASISVAVPEESPDRTVRDFETTP